MTADKTADPLPDWLPPFPIPTEFTMPAGEDVSIAVLKALRSGDSPDRMREIMMEPFIEKTFRPIIADMVAHVVKHHAIRFPLNMPLRLQRNGVDFCGVELGDVRDVELKRPNKGQFETVKVMYTIDLTLTAPLIIPHWAEEFALVSEVEGSLKVFIHGRTDHQLRIRAGVERSSMNDAWLNRLKVLGLCL